jgi:hypothetical protein
MTECPWTCRLEEQVDLEPRVLPSLLWLPLLIQMCSIRYDAVCIITEQGVQLVTIFSI